MNGTKRYSSTSQKPNIHPDDLDDLIVFLLLQRRAYKAEVAQIDRMDFDAMPSGIAEYFRTVRRSRMQLIRHAEKSETKKKKRQR